MLAAVVSSLVVWQTERHAREDERIHLGRLVSDHVHTLEHGLERTLAATHVMSALIQAGQGQVANFDAVARNILAAHAGASALALAPQGVIRDIAPATPGNLAAVGLDLLRAPAVRTESIRTLRSGQLTLAGPLRLAGGGSGVVGRLPVFLDAGAAKPVFWGFVVVVVRLPEGLQNTRLWDLRNQGFAFELWRRHPETGARQIIARSGDEALIEPIHVDVDVPNAKWILSVAPLDGWGHQLALPLKAALGLLFSLMLAYLVGLFVELRAHRRLLEARVEARTADILLAQRKLRTTLDAIPDLVWLKDADSVYLSCNAMFERVIGAAEADIAGKTDYDLFDRAQAEFFRENDRKTVAARRPHTNDEWLTSASDGVSRLYEVIKTPLTDGSGTLIGVLGIARDITGRVEAQRALQASQQRAQQYLNIVGVILVALDTEGRVQLVNRRGCELLGMSESQILGKDWFIHFLPGDARDEIRQVFHRLLRGELDVVEYNENVIVTAKGEERAIAWHNALLQDEAGNVTGVLASGEDITERRQAERAERESRENLRLLLDSMAEGAYGVDFDGNCTFVNRAFLRILGYDDEREVLDKRIHALIHHTRPDGSPYPESECQIYRAYRANQAINVSDEVFWRKDNVPVPVEYWSNPIIRDDLVTGAIATFVDIRERKRAEAQLALAAKVFEQSGEGILITDAQLRIIMVNQALTAITGYSEEELLGQTPRLLSSGRHDRAFYSAMWDAIAADGRWQGEVWNRRKDGDLYPEMLSIIRVRDAQGEVTHYIGISSDITRHKEAQAHIQRLAHFDPLTGLPNRVLLSERVRHDLSTAQRNHTQLAVLFVDLDHFKNVNDTLGHRIGDELLIAVGKRLKASVREVDTVSRQGGDEFVLVLPDTDADGVTHVAAKLLEAVAQPYAIEEFELTVTLSIGITVYPGDGEDFEVLSKRADAAMYRAKHDGRNTYRFYTSEMQARAAHNLQMENALRRALERNQLELHYQPQISLHDNCIIGVEALLRWQHPELGAIAPSDFIPIAEECGQILPIGEWALRKAIRQVKTWMDAGLAPVVMAVNLSVVQFRHPQLPERIAQLLDEAKLPPECLELELTESIAMDDAPAAIAVIDRLHARGVRMSIDDFGTGYSSLSYLKRLKVHRLKIDQSFVSDICEDSENRAIVDAVISMAHSLGLPTIAEGVETEAQLEYLRAHGCDEVQGYFFSKPLPADAFEAYVRARYPEAWTRS